MDLENFNLATANKYELKFYAKEKLDLSLTMNMSEGTMREKIQAEANGRDDVEAPKAEIIVKQRSGRKPTEYAIINISKSDKKGGAEPIFVGVQGVGYTIPRSINIKVPMFIVHALNNAMQDHVTQDIETGELHHDPILTYPFQIVERLGTNQGQHSI